MSRAARPQSQPLRTPFKPSDPLDFHFVDIQQIVIGTLKTHPVMLQIKAYAEKYNQSLQAWRNGGAAPQNIQKQKANWKNIEKRIQTIQFFSKHISTKERQILQLRGWVKSILQKPVLKIPQQQVLAVERMDSQQECNDPDELYTKGRRTLHPQLKTPAERLRSFKRKVILKQNQVELAEIQQLQPKLQQTQFSTGRKEPQETQRTLLQTVQKEEQLIQLVQHDNGQLFQQQIQIIPPVKPKKFIVPRPKPYTSQYHDKMKLIRQPFQKGNFRYSSTLKQFSQEPININLERLKKNQLQHEERHGALEEERHLINWGRSKSRSQTEISRRIAQREANRQKFQVARPAVLSAEQLQQYEWYQSKIKGQGQQLSLQRSKRRQNLTAYKRQTPYPQVQNIKLSDFLMVQKDKQIQRPKMMSQTANNFNRSQKTISQRNSDYNRAEKTSLPQRTAETSAKGSHSLKAISHTPVVLVPPFAMLDSKQQNYQRQLSAQINNKRLQSAKLSQYKMIAMEVEQIPQFIQPVERSTSISFFARKQAVPRQDSSLSKKSYNDESQTQTQRIKYALNKNGVNIAAANIYKGLTIPQEQQQPAAEAKIKNIYMGFQNLPSNPWAVFPVHGKRKKKKKK